VGLRPPVLTRCQASKTIEPGTCRNFPCGALGVDLASDGRRWVRLPSCKDGTRSCRPGSVHNCSRPRDATSPSGGAAWRPEQKWGARRKGPLKTGRQAVVKRSRPTLAVLSTPEDESAAAKQENEDDDDQQRLGTHSSMLERPTTRRLYQKEQSCQGPSALAKYARVAARDRCGTRRRLALKAPVVQVEGHILPRHRAR
jgi:hypothetical protein